MKLTAIFAGISSFLAIILSLIIPAYRNKIKGLQQDVSDKDAEIELRKLNSKIKKEINDLNFSDLSSKLRKAKDATKK